MEPLTDAICDFCPDSPYREPRWRWGFAHFLLEEHLPVRRKWRDEWFERTLKYVRALRRIGDPVHRKLARLDPEVFAARQLHRGDERLRFEIEVRVLANQGPAEIAECCGVSRDVLSAFENVFYDMRRLLGAEDYIRMKTHPTLISRPEVPDLEATVRAMAYATGPFVVDAALRVYDEMRDPSRLIGKPDAHPRLTEVMRDSIRFFAWANNPKNHRFGHALWLLYKRTEQAGIENDIGKLLRPLSSTVSFGAAMNPSGLAPESPRSEDSQPCEYPDIIETKKPDQVQHVARIVSTG
jgi:hypothetical protein